MAIVVIMNQVYVCGGIHDGCTSHESQGRPAWTSYMQHMRTCGAQHHIEESRILLGGSLEGTVSTHIPCPSVWNVRKLIAGCAESCCDHQDDKLQWQTPGGDTRRDRPTARAGALCWASQRQGVKAAEARSDHAGDCAQVRRTAVRAAGLWLTGDKHGCIEAHRLGSDLWDC